MKLEEYQKVRHLSDKAKELMETLMHTPEYEAFVAEAAAVRHGMPESMSLIFDMRFEVFDLDWAESMQLTDGATTISEPPERLRDWEVLIEQSSVSSYAKASEMLYYHLKRRGDPSDYLSRLTGTRCERVAPHGICPVCWRWFGANSKRGRWDHCSDCRIKVSRLRLDDVKPQQVLPLETGEKDDRQK